MMWDRAGGGRRGRDRFVEPGSKTSRREEDDDYLFIFRFCVEIISIFQRIISNDFNFTSTKNHVFVRMRTYYTSFTSNYSMSVRRHPKIFPTSAFII